MQRKMISGESVKKTLLKDVAVASFLCIACKTILH